MGRHVGREVGLRSASDRGGQGVGDVGEGAHLGGDDVAHARQSRPDSALGVQAKALKTF